MEAIKLTCYKNWSIKIECERYEHDSGPPTFTAIAIITYIGRNPATGTKSECFVASLPGVVFHDSRAANEAVQQEAMGRIDALPIHLSAVLDSLSHSNPAKPLAGSDTPA